MRRLKASESPPTLTDEGRSRLVASSDAAEYFRNVATAWAKAKPAVRATMLQSGYERVTVKGGVRQRPSDPGCLHARIRARTPEGGRSSGPSHTGRQPVRGSKLVGAPDRIRGRGCHKYPHPHRRREDRGGRAKRCPVERAARVGGVREWAIDQRCVRYLPEKIEARPSRPADGSTSRATLARMATSGGPKRTRRYRAGSPGQPYPPT